MSSSNCCFLTCIQVSQEAGQVIWYSHLFQNFPQFIVIHTVKGLGIVNKAKIAVFVELSCFFDDPSDVGDFISGSSAFSKTSLNTWMFMVHILLKPGLENFEHYFTSMWDECNCAVVWAFLALPFFGIGMKTGLFQSCGHCWVFQIGWYSEHSPPCMCQHSLLRTVLSMNGTKYQALPPAWGELMSSTHCVLMRYFLKDWIGLQKNFQYSPFLGGLKKPSWGIKISKLKKKTKKTGW